MRLTSSLPAPLGQDPSDFPLVPWDPAGSEISQAFENDRKPRPVLLLPSGRDTPRYRYRVELDGREYAIVTTWNEPARAWILSFYNATGALLRGGVQVVKDWPLLARGGDERLPPGRLFALDASRENLQLVYVGRTE